MTTISARQFIQATTDWVTPRDKLIGYNWPVNGGWEGWIQVDETAYLLSRDSALEVLREQHVYTNPRKRCDLLLNYSARTENQVVIEIKAQSLGNTPSFMADVVKDLDKLNELTDDYQEATCLVMVVVFQQAMLQQVQAIERQARRIFGVTYHSKEVAICFAEWTSEDGWTAAPSIADGSPDATTWTAEANPANHATTHPLFGAPSARPS